MSDGMLGRTRLLKQTAAAALCVVMAVSVVAGVAFGESSAEIIINIPAFTLHLYLDGVPHATYPIGVGQVVKPSLLGETQIVNRVFYPTYYPPDWYTKGLQPIPPGPDNPVGTRWLGLGFQGYGIHGTNDPMSIGTPASSGCIRMYNQHVEELAELVGVGTTVRFVYDTIQAWRDPVTGAGLIKVHPDIYRQGTNTIEEAMRELTSIDAAEGVDRRMLAALLAEAAAQPRPIPKSVPLSIDGERIGVQGVDYGGRILIPLDPVADYLGMTVSQSTRLKSGEVSVGGLVVPESFWLGGRAFAPVEAAAEGFGLIVEAFDANGIELRSVSLVDRGERLLPVRTHVIGDWLLLPVQDVARLLGVDIGWDRALEAVVVDGRPIFGVFLIENRAYLPHDRLADLLGIRISWVSASAVAMLQTAEVRMTSIGGGIESAQGFVYGSDVYVPLRLITDQLEYTLGWNQATQTAFVQGVPVRGVVRDGRVFTPVNALLDIVPALDFQWNDEAFDLTINLGVTASGP